MAAGLGSLVIFVCYASARWAPWFLTEMAWQFTGALAPGPGLFSVVVGLGFAAVPWIALRWPTLAICLALLPTVVALIDPAPSVLHFGVYASLCTVAITAGWRSPRGALLAGLAGYLTILGWLLVGETLAAPFGATIDPQYGGGPQGLGVAYGIVTGLVLLGAAGLKVAATRELEHRRLAARSDEVELQAAVVGERARLARDLHDVVAHHVSLIAVRAETAPYTHPTLEAPAREVLADIAADARLALDELRGVLGILGRADGSPERAPQPSWQDIAALVHRARSAGAQVFLDGDAPEPASVGAAVGYAAYRVVQEALTNARKHAPGLPVTVTLTTTGRLHVVRVENPRTGDDRAPAGGHGLVGMRERVEALGGRLVTGPAGDVFVVEATLPQVSA